MLDELCNGALDAERAIRVEHRFSKSPRTTKEADSRNEAKTKLFLYSQRQGANVQFR